MDRAVRERLLEFGHALIGDLGIAEIEMPHFGHPLEMYQPAVGDECVVKPEPRHGRCIGFAGQSLCLFLVARGGGKSGP